MVESDPRRASDQRFFAFVEWSEVCARIAEHAESSAAKHLLRELAPGSDLAAVSRARSLSAEALALGEERPSLSGASSLKRAREIQEQGGFLTGFDLRGLHSLLAAAERGRAAYGESPQLGALLAPSSEEQAAAERDLADAIEAAIDDYGGVRDSASEALEALRREALSARARLGDGLRQVMANGGVSIALVEHRPIEHEGQPCLLVKLSEVWRVPGPILCQRPDGYCVQPDALAPLYNGLRDVELAIREECARITRSLSEACVPWLEALFALGDGLVRADLHQAFARYGEATAGRLAEPLATSEERSVDLRGARHPLLLAEEDGCTPIEWVLDPGTRALVISGPNGGGKTAAMKTLGLCAILAQIGCPVPARACRLPIFESFVAVGQTHSSVEGGLSTFQAHAAELARALDEAGPRSLVLLDEPGVGTDPGEAAALAQATVEFLLQRELLILVTTHLPSLKAFGQRHELARSAAVALDAKGRPTFALELDAVGRSYALDAAKHAGLPSALISRALELHAGGE